MQKCVEKSILGIIFYGNITVKQNEEKLTIGWIMRLWKKFFNNFFTNRYMYSLHCIEFFEKIKKGSHGPNLGAGWVFVWRSQFKSVFFAANMHIFHKLLFTFHYHTWHDEKDQTVVQNIFFSTWKFINFHGFINRKPPKNLSYVLCVNAWLGSFLSFAWFLNKKYIFMYFLLGVSQHGIYE